MVNLVSFNSTVGDMLGSEGHLGLISSDLLLSKASNKR